MPIFFSNGLWMPLAQQSSWGTNCSTNGIATYLQHQKSWNQRSLEAVQKWYRPKWTDRLIQGNPIRKVKIGLKFGEKEQLLFSLTNHHTVCTKDDTMVHAYTDANTHACHICTVDIRYHVYQISDPHQPTAPWSNCHSSLHHGAVGHRGHHRGRHRGAILGAKI